MLIPRRSKVVWSIPGGQYEKVYLYDSDANNALRDGECGLGTNYSIF